MSENDHVELQPGEHLVLVFRKHWFILFLKLMGVVLSAIAPFLMYAYFDTLGAIPPGLRAAHVFEYAGTFWLIVMWWALAGVWTKYYLEMWAITSRRVIRMEQVGLFNREVTVWGAERILEVTVRVANIVETFLDYGTLQIQTAGPVDNYESIHGVPHPNKVRESIMTQSSRLSSLEEANRNQEKLLHTISHEVKSYLTKDAASLASIAEGSMGADPEKVRSFAQMALGETRKGVSAVMEMLSGSDTKTGAMHLGNEVFDLKTLAEELVAQFMPVAERKKLSFELSASAPCQMRGDKVKLRDLVLRNLIDNALRYTSHGSVQVSLLKEGNTAVFSVSDTGVGISSEDMPKLFTEGGKGKHSSQVNPDSTGFGLASAKQIVDAHNGSIRAHSAGTGRGAMFVVTLPLAQ